MIKIFVFFVFLTLSSGFEPEKHRNWNLLPHDTCGQVGSNRIIGGVEAAMNSYPWLVRLGYELPGVTQISFLCGGALVHAKIVLTAAHCVSDPNLPKVAVIRLGEHDTETDPDCDGDFCADPVVDISPVEILTPKDYNNPLFKHDVALIRLKDEVKFSVFVKPICIGGGEFSKKNFIGSITEVAGWGIYDIVRVLSSSKLQYVRLPVVDNEECRRHFPDSVDIGPTQICAGGEVGKDSCGGDSGGPLMKVDDGPYGPRYYVLGVVSFGAQECGATEAPGVYTKFPEYLEWFLDNLEETTDESLRVL